MGTRRRGRREEKGDCGLDVLGKRRLNNKKIKTTSPRRSQRTLMDKSILDILNKVQTPLRIED